MENRLVWKIIPAEAAPPPMSSPVDAPTIAGAMELFETELLELKRFKRELENLLKSDQQEATPFRILMDIADTEERIHNLQCSIAECLKMMPRGIMNTRDMKN